MDDPSGETRMSEALRWAIEAEENPALAAADWLTRDISPRYQTAYDLLSDPDVSISDLVAAKNAYKTMRIVGETVLDRQLAARLYAAAIAAALVRFNQRISTQSPVTIKRALVLLENDPEVPEAVRNIAALAIHMLDARDRP